MVREIPLSVLFTWPAPNYVNPDTRGPALLVVNAVFITLCTITLFLRLYTRIFIKRWFGSDDVFIILAYVRAHPRAKRARADPPRYPLSA